MLTTSLSDTHLLALDAQGKDQVKQEMTKKKEGSEEKEGEEKNEEHREREFNDLIHMTYACDISNFSLQVDIEGIKAGAVHYEAPCLQTITNPPELV